jgi:hypothetical protein
MVLIEEGKHQDFIDKLDLITTEVLRKEMEPTR